MAKKGKKNSTFSKVISVILSAILIIACVYFKIDGVENVLPQILSLFGTDSTIETNINPTTPPVVKEQSDTTAGSYTDDSLTVYFFDVGQADSILLMTNGKTMLVDTGNAGDADTSDKVKDKINLTHELKRLGVEYIDILVATHPHEDHMGSTYKIVNAFDIGDVYITAYEEKFTKNYYERFWDAVQEKNVHIISPTTLSDEEIIAKVEEYNKNLSKDEEVMVYDESDYIRLGDTIEFGEALVTMIAPSSAEYSDTNDYSIVLMVEFEGVKLLLTGDAGKESEEEMLVFAAENNFDMNVDILKVGHHGSRTANTEEFIEAVDPEYAIIMVEEGNSYGLPDEDVIERLQNHGATIYSTMEKGDIKLIIDDGKYEFDFSYDYEVKE